MAKSLSVSVRQVGIGKFRIRCSVCGMLGGVFKSRAAAWAWDSQNHHHRKFR